MVAASDHALQLILGLGLFRPTLLFQTGFVFASKRKRPQQEYS